jgi:hypothetical protein
MRGRSRSASSASSGRPSRLRPTDPPVPMNRASTLERRLANHRAAVRSGRTLGPAGPEAEPDRCLPRAAVSALAVRLAAALDGEAVRTDRGTYVRCESPSRPIPVDRERLARLPGQPPRDVPLVCLDTETTGLATAAGTVAFLVGLGWWEGDDFRQVQLLLPDHSDEAALLEALADLIPPTSWIVTYNGRGFDWPLLVARYRLARRGAPAHAGHLDLLPLVRRLFRHRMTDARLRTAEAHLLGLHRVGDVEGWEIPGRYLDFLRGGSAAPIAEVVRHNDQDVRSLARLLAHVEQGYADPAMRARAPRGDLAGLARAFARERRLGEALECLEAAAAAPETARPVGSVASLAGSDGDDWWSPRRRPDFGGRPARPAGLAGSVRPVAFDAPWTDERIALDRAHLLRRLGRIPEAAEAWAGLAAGPGRVAVLASIELAKLREHRLGDLPGAIEATHRGIALAERRRRLGRPEPALEIDLGRRLARLRVRHARRAGEAA